MGEYAKRKSDGEEVKIGTCESMYYIRWEDRNKVSKLPNSLDPATTTGLYWRLPFPDEDGVLIGAYQDYNRGYRLFKVVEEPDNPQLCYRKICADFAPADMADAKPGFIQLRHEQSGLLMNIPCYHGAKLPDPPPGGQVFWNGKGHALELSSVKNMPDGTLLPVVRCRFCGKMWSFDWAEIMPYVFDDDMRKRLEEYARIKQYNGGLQ